MNKDQLVEAVMEASGLDVKATAKTVVESVFDIIAKTLSKGDEVAVAGFGIFKVTKRAARQGVNPKTGEKIQIGASIVPKFRAGKALKDAVK